MRDNRGSVVVETVVLVPVIVMALVFVIGCGRWVQAEMTVRNAVDQAARSASMVAAGRMRVVGLSQAERQLGGSRSGCVDGRADVSTFRSGRMMFVRAVASCRVDLRGLTGLFGLPRSVSASTVEVVDVFTFR